MNDTDRSLPSGVPGELIPSLGWSETLDWVRTRPSSREEPLWFSGSNDPIVVIAALSQLVAGLHAGIFVTDVTNRPPLLAAKQIMTVNQLCDGRLQLLDDGSALAGEVCEQLERVGSMEATEGPRVLCL